MQSLLSWVILLIHKIFWGIHYLTRLWNAALGSRRGLTRNKLTYGQSASYCIRWLSNHYQCSTLAGLELTYLKFGDHQTIFRYHPFIEKAEVCEEWKKLFHWFQFEAFKWIQKIDWVWWPTISCFLIFNSSIGYLSDDLFEIEVFPDLYFILYCLFFGWVNNTCRSIKNKINLILNYVISSPGYHEYP